MELGLRGHARNTDDGRVEVVAQGPADAVQRLVDLLSDPQPAQGRPGRVSGATVSWLPPTELAEGFGER